MFDEVYEKIKRTILPKKNLPAQNVVSENKKETAPASLQPQTKNETPSATPTTVSTANVALPQKPAPAKNSGKLQDPASSAENPWAKKTLSLEEQKQLLFERRHIPAWILFLKYFSLLLAISSGVAYLWLKADLETTNKYFSVVGLKENVGLRFENLTKQKRSIESETRSLEGKIRKIEQQLESKQYSIYTDSIRKIQEGQLIWFDQKDAEGNLQYGLLEAPKRMQEYFNSKSFQDSLLSNTGNNILVDNVYADRSSVSFGVTGSQLFGKVFSLNSEFMKMINSFPLFKGGVLTNFSKKADSEGTESMSFNTKLTLQGKDEKDPADENFIKYEKWLLTQPSS